MGYSMRSDRYRYTEWLGRKKTEAGKRSAFAKALYDYETDPAGNVNLANRPEHQALVSTLSRALHTGWRGALPPGIPSALKRPEVTPPPQVIEWLNGQVNIQPVLAIKLEGAAGPSTHALLERFKANLPRDGLPAEGYLLEINSQGAELMVLAREDGAWKIKAIHWSSRQRR